MKIAMLHDAHCRAPLSALSLGLLLCAPVIGCGDDDSDAASDETSTTSGGMTDDSEGDPTAGTETGGSAGETAAEESSTGESTTPPPEGCDLFVEVGDDDQTAVQEALIEVTEGSTVCLGEGTFTFNRQLALNTNGVTVRGAGREATVLDFEEQVTGGGGNGLLVTGNDVTIETLGVRNPPGDGIRADQVENITFRSVAVIWELDDPDDAGAYGLYPVLSTGVHVDDCLVVGSRDAGIYVGQSTNILVENSEVYGNVAGIEVENSTVGVVRNNYVHDNTGGILVFNLPGLDVTDGKLTNVYQNRVENNNLPNFGEPGTVVALIPAGIGILVLASDNNEIHDNDISGNVSAAVGMISYIELLFGDPNDPEFDRNAEGNWVHDNRLTDNATDPDAIVQFLIGGADNASDVVDDGCYTDGGDLDALRNCVTDNGKATYVNADYCEQLGGASTDLETANCTRDPLPLELPSE